ncbi:MAG TPA: hypothetical protein VKU00_01205 [Chthonomonadaceae bacterium]|nr:hypothetical protein [Chthonomonadaceae bacterium]
MRSRLFIPLVLCWLAGCATQPQTVTMKEVLAHPMDYDGQVIRLQGTVVKLFNVPVLYDGTQADADRELKIMSKGGTSTPSQHPNWVSIAAVTTNFTADDKVEIEGKFDGKSGTILPSSLTPLR